MKDLEGLLVVALEQAVAAPLASCKLADAGARVIKIERPEGDFARNYDSLARGLSSYFVWLNRGKESLCLDLKQSEDLALLKRIVGKADIFIQNLAPGAAARLGLEADELQHSHPALIACSISGYGETGPYREQKAYDMLVQGETGLISINGNEHGMARVGISVCDIAAGTAAYGAILEALIARHRTGRGRAIEVSLFGALADWMNVPYLQAKYGGKEPQRVGVRHPTISPYGAFACADGKVVLLSIQNEREWRRFCVAVLNDAGLADDPLFNRNNARVKNNETLDRIIASTLSQMPREQAIEALNNAGIACGRVSSMDDLISHPQLRTMTVATERGDIDIAAPGPVVAGSARETSTVPRLGEHTGLLRKEFAADQ